MKDRFIFEMSIGSNKKLFIIAIIITGRIVSVEISSSVNFSFGEFMSTERRHGESNPGAQ